MAVISGTDAGVYVHSGSGIVFTNNTTVANDARTRYTLSNNAKRHWTAATLLVEEDTGGGYAEVTPDVINRNAGWVSFVTPRAANATIRISGTYMATSEAGTAKDWELSIEHEDLDATAFGNTWKVISSGIGSATVKFGSWYVDDYYLTAIGTLVTVVLFLSETSDTYYTATGRLDQSSIKTEEGQLITSDVTLELDAVTYDA